jgi:hypothetical protein
LPLAPGRPRGTKFDNRFQTSFASFPRAALGHPSYSTEPRAKQNVPGVKEDGNPIEGNLIDQRQARQGKAPAPNISEPTLD